MIALSTDRQRELIRNIAGASDTRNLACIRDEAEQSVDIALEQDDPLTPVGKMVAGLNDALVARLIVLTERRLQTKGEILPPVRFCWLSFGSDGRQEQCIRTDQDTAIVYEDPPAGLQAAAAHYFTSLGMAVTDGLAACGFSRCPGNNMASNPEWCQPFSVWRSYVHRWLRIPEPLALLHASTIFDFRPAYGDATLAQALRRAITDELAIDRTSLLLMARDALHHPPPTTFFGRLVCEPRGPQAGHFDIKLRAIKPTTEAVRLLALDAGIHEHTGTVERLGLLSETDQSIREIGAGVASAYTLFLRYRSTHGKRSVDGGRYLDVSHMDAHSTTCLRDAIERTEALLTLIRVRYQLDVLGLR